MSQELRENRVVKNPNKYRKPRDLGTVPRGGSELKTSYRKTMGWVVKANGIFDKDGKNLSMVCINDQLFSISPYPSKPEMENSCSSRLRRIWPAASHSDSHSDSDSDSASASASTSEAKSAADIAELADSLEAFCNLCTAYVNELKMTHKKL